MADQQTRTSGTTHNAVISLLLPCLLIGNFLWCVLTPAHEYQMRTDQMLTMGLDLLGLLGVIGLRPRGGHWPIGAAPQRRCRLVDRPSRLFAVAAMSVSGSPRHFARRPDPCVA